MTDFQWPTPGTTEEYEKYFQKTLEDRIVDQLEEDAFNYGQVMTSDAPYQARTTLEQQDGK